MTTASREPITTTPVAGPTPRPRRWWIRPDRPAWSSPARAAIAVLAAVLYSWDLSRSGMGNSFYAAAVKSGTESWKAFLFGSLDPGSFITVDKPPASLWVMELSGRIFGFSTWSMLLPEAAAGVASVLLLYRVVRRWQGELAAVLAALALTLTPIAVVMFRYNNPDALLTFLLVAAAWALWSAVESGATSRLVLCGALVGLAFMTKTLEAFVVVPGFALVYLCCGPQRLVRRCVQTGWAALALVASSAWWVVIVELWPASSRPYIGGSTDNSELNLIFGYNGFGRLSGSESGLGGIGAGSGFGGQPGPLRMFNGLVGGQISWLIPFALAGLVAGLWLQARSPRADLARAGFLLWGTWALCTMVVFSDARGIFHPYYTVILAPPIAALAAGGGVALWRLGRRSRWYAPALPAAVVGNAVWAAVLLRRTPHYYRGLPTAIVIVGIVAAAALAVSLTRVLAARWLAVTAGGIATATLLAGPVVYSLTSIRDAGNGPLASAGPGGGFGGLGGIGGPGGTGGITLTPQLEKALRARGIDVTPEMLEAFRAGGVPGGGGAAGGGTAAADLENTNVNTKLVDYLLRHQGSSKYLLAVNGSQTAAPYILHTGKPVIAMGGFIGSDPAPTLAGFIHLVAAGQVHYVLVGGGFGAAAAGFMPGGTTAAGKLPTGGGLPAPGGFGGTTSSVQRWVETHGTKVPTADYNGNTQTGTLYYIPTSAAAP
jgi:4-amino-4-deoxy-L-arabinose transferase-like glycosyltransferase